MTLYDITLTHEDTDDDERGMRRSALAPNKKLTVTVTPYRPLLVPPGSSLVIKRQRVDPPGPDVLEAHETGAGVYLVHRGDSFYTNSRIIDGYVLTQLEGDATQYLARAGEQLIEDSIRAIAEIKVREAKL